MNHSAAAVRGLKVPLLKPPIALNTCFYEALFLLSHPLLPVYIAQWEKRRLEITQCTFQEISRFKVRLTHFK